MDLKNEGKRHNDTRTVNERTAHFNVATEIIEVVHNPNNRKSAIRTIDVSHHCHFQATNNLRSEFSCHEKKKSTLAA